MDEFDQAVIEALQHYVYRLEDPRKSSEPRTFYVGKGQGNRAFQHARDALDNSTESDKLERIREILHSGLTPTIIIHRHGLDESTAFHVEAALIDAYGIDNLTNEVKGQKSAQGMLTTQEVAEFYHAVPISIEDPVVLIKIEREWRKDLTAEQLYERTRRYWFISPKKNGIIPLTHVRRWAILAIKEGRHVSETHCSPVLRAVSRRGQVPRARDGGPLRTPA